MKREKILSLNRPKDLDATFCEHILPGRISVFGRPSTMVKVLEDRDFGIIKCERCNYEETIQKRAGLVRVQTNAAEGQRLEHLSRYSDDVLQPTLKDGTENKRFTRLYGYNPNSKDPKVPKSPPPPEIN